MKFFQKYLSVWVILCMIIGVSIGHFFPMIPNILNKFEYAGISIPMAVLIWIMIYPMMIKVNFKSVKYISKNPKGLFVTWIVNWLIKPFTMYGIACSFFFVLFRAFIPVELATEYLAGAVLLGAAPCTAMVFVWSSLTQGNPVYTVVQVATNDIIILFAFGPIVKILLGVSNVAVPFNTIFLSVVLFVVIPLVGGIITRMAVIRKHDENYLNQQFLNKFDSVTTIGLAELAEKYNCKMSQIAIAWQWAKGILSPIIGATKTQYLDDSAGAFDIKLTAEDLAYLEEPYVPHEIVGAIDKNPAQGVILLDEKK